MSKFIFFNFSYYILWLSRGMKKLSSTVKNQKFRINQIFSIISKIILRQKLRIFISLNHSSMSQNSKSKSKQKAISKMKLTIQNFKTLSIYFEKWKTIYFSSRYKIKRKNFLQQQIFESNFFFIFFCFYFFFSKFSKGSLLQMQVIIIKI